jgi:hypothetical protein
MTEVPATSVPEPPESSQEPHPRDVVVDLAGRELVPWLNDWRNRHQLTTAEYLNILNVLMAAYIRQMGIVEREALLRGVTT